MDTSFLKPAFETQVPVEPPAQNADLRPINRYISETIADMHIVTMED